MDKTMKTPLIALSILTTQLVILLGNTTIIKSAEHKPTGNNHKEISQTYYDRQMKIETMPVMYEQEKQTELISQSYGQEYNQRRQKELESKTHCNKLGDYWTSIGYAGAYFIDSNKVYYYDLSNGGCEASYRGTLDDQPLCDYSLGDCVQWKLEGTQLCEYTKYFPNGDIGKNCRTRNNLR
jgi:hypothetical protein